MNTENISTDFSEECTHSASLCPRPAAPQESSSATKEEEEEEEEEEADKGKQDATNYASAYAIK